MTRTPTPAGPKPKPARVSRRRPQQARSQETVRAILDAAERLLHAKSGSFTTNRVASLAGVSIGSVYEYFPTKQAIVRAVEERSWAGISALLAGKVRELIGKPIAYSVRE